LNKLLTGNLLAVTMSVKKKDGFEGEKFISIPNAIWKKANRLNPLLKQLYIKHIGYFPKAIGHYRERKKGCEDNILIYCLKGKGWVKIKNQTFTIKVNEFILIPATTQPMSYGADEQDPWTIYWVHFSGDSINLFNKTHHIDLYDGPQPITFNEKGLQIWETMYQSLEMGYSTENITYSNMCLYHLIATFLYPGKHANDKKQESKDLINDTVLYMRENINHVLTVEDMAKHSNRSASHFSTLFRKATGMSPLDYFIHLKLQKACLLLFNTNKKVKEVAADLGYQDPYYFSRLFKKYMEVSPEQYRSIQDRNHQTD